MKRTIFLAICIATLGAVTTGRAMDQPPIYERKCFNCHSIAGVGGKKADKGGKLDGVGSKYDEAWIRGFLENPRSQDRNSKMRPIDLSPEDHEAVVQYMMSLK